MTVRELMEKLSHYNPNADVLLTYTDEVGDTVIANIDNFYFDVPMCAVMLENIF